MLKKFRPLGDRVLVKRLEAEDVTAGGIIIPDAAKERAQTGEVVAVGPGRLDPANKIIPMNVRVGDVIFFGKYAGTDAGDDFLIIKEDDILGVIEK